MSTRPERKSPQLSNAEQETEAAAERLNTQIEAALASVATRNADDAGELEAYADRIERSARDLSVALRERVLPSLGAHAGSAHGQAPGAGGDITFAIDAAAEEMLEEFLAERAPGVAFLSEDRGLVEPAGAAGNVLVVDPIDGTRPALAGLESCCVSVAAAPRT